MTGRAAGYCAGYNVPGYANPVGGRGFGMGYGRGFGFWGRGGGRGGGFGWRNRFFATGVPGWAWFGGYGGAYQNVDPETEKQALKNQADFLETELKSIKTRLDEIETGKKPK
jgi:hypothetical protein